MFTHHHSLPLDYAGSVGGYPSTNHAESSLRRNLIRRYAGGIQQFRKNVYGYHLQSRSETALAKFTETEYKDVASNATVSNGCSSRGRGRHSFLRTGIASLNPNHSCSASLAVGRCSGSLSVIRRMSGNKKSTLEKFYKNYERRRKGTSAEPSRRITLV